MITSITLDVSTPKGKRKRSETVPFFFDVNNPDIKYAYPIDKGRYIRIMLGSEILDINTTDELLDSLVRRFGEPQQQMGFKPANLIPKTTKRTPKKEVRK